MIFLLNIQFNELTQENMSSSDLLYSLFEQHVNSNKSKSTNNNVSNGLDRYTQRMHRLHCIKHDTINEAMTKIELMVK